MKYEDVRKLPWQQQIDVYAKDKNLYNQEISRVKNVLQTNPTDQAKRWYAQINAVNQGAKAQDIVNNKVDLNPYMPGVQSKPTMQAQTGLNDPYTQRSPYTQYINDTLSQLVNRKPFEYDPRKDEAYQNFLDQAKTQSKEVFNNQMGTLSSMTGGRPNSWATSTASQAQQQIMGDARNQVGQFQQMAYDRYNDDYNQQMKKLTTLMDLDDTTYKRYRDNIEDQYKQLDYQIKQEQMAITEKKEEIALAWDRTKTQGFVDNYSAKILGLKPGTPSYEAQERINELQDKVYLIEQENKYKMQYANYKASSDMKLFAQKEALKLKNKLIGLGAEKQMDLEGDKNNPNFDGDPYNDTIEVSDRKQMKEWIEDYKEFVSDTTKEGYDNLAWKKLPDQEKINHVLSFMDNVKTMNKGRGMKDLIADRISKTIIESDVYKELVKPYIEQKKEYDPKFKGYMNAFNNVTPGQTVDFNMYTSGKFNK